MRASRKLTWLPFTIPFFIFYSMDVLYPVLASFYFSLFKDGKFIGLSAFYEILSSKSIINLKSLSNIPLSGALPHTIILVVCLLTFSIMIGLLLAILFRGIKGGSIVKYIIYAYLVIPPAAMGIVIRAIFEKNFGIVPSIFQLLGASALDKTWTVDMDLAFWSVVIGVIYTQSAFNMIYFSAGLEALPKDVLEAAELDGAPFFIKLFKIIIPLLRPVLIFVVFVTYVLGFRTFDLAFVATGGGPGKASTLLAIEQYYEFFSYWNLERATAISVLTTILCLPLSLFIARRARS